MAHSYGTFVASRIVQAHKPYCHSLSLIDPVCFGEWKVPPACITLAAKQRITW